MLGVCGGGPADTDRDFFMTPEEARDYGIIDEVIQTKKSNLPKPPKPVLT